MKVAQRNKYRTWIINKLSNLINKIENSGSGDFNVNGENKFIRMLGEKYKNKEFIGFDIGANMGEYTAMCLKYIPTKNIRLYLFEPQAKCIETITNKFSKRPEVIINNFGLSDKEGTVTLYKDKEQSGLASIYNRNLSYYNIKNNLTETIKLNNPQNYIKQNNILHINLIKIDIEGHELKALKGFGDFLNIDNVDFIQFEYGGANMDSHTTLLELFTFFEKRKFILCKIMHKELEKRIWIPNMENFVLQNFVAISPKVI